VYTISLVNMPFANPALPSIALTQLKAVAEQALGNRVRIRILYLNQEFAHFLGAELYSLMVSGLEANNSGLGDWLFRQLAFPELADNTRQYFQRYFPPSSEEVQAMKGLLLAKRAGLERYMQQTVARHRLAEENLVGFTSMFAQNVASFALARTIKLQNPQTVILIGGANCEAPMGPELARHIEAVDFVFSGPALVSFPQFLHEELAGEPARRHRIPGVFSRQNLDSAHLQGRGAIGEDLPIEVPVPLDYESFLQDLARNFPDGRIKPSLTFETSRGCWWGERAHCTFCGLNGGTMSYRAMPFPQAFEQFESLFGRYADRCQRFESVDNIMPREYLKELFPRLRSPKGVTIFYEVKADLKDRELEILSRAGVTQIQPGIEALATSTLKLMKKGTTSFQNLVFLKNCLKHGIRPLWNLLIGFPGEEEAVYRKYLADLQRLMHLPPPSGAFPVRFDRFSPYFVRSVEYGLELAPYDFYRFIYPLDEEALAKVAYYFEDRNYNARYMTQMIAWKDKLSAAVQRWNERFRGEDGRPRAELRAVRRNGSLVLHDSRSGEVAEHELDDLQARVLACIHGTGLRLPDIVDRLDVGEAAVMETLTGLQRLDLVFKENDRFLGLLEGIDSLAAEPEPALASSTAQNL